MKNSQNLMVDLVGKRERLLAQIEYLTRKEVLIGDNHIKYLVRKEKETASSQLRDIDSQLIEYGLPLYDNEIAHIFETINNELNQLETHENLIEWIKENATKEYKKKIENLYSESKINPKLSGKWIGNFISEDHCYNLGEFSFGICQLGSKIFGYGGLLDSMYTKVFITGIADEDEIRVEVSGRAMRVKSFFQGAINEENGKVIIEGKYYVEDGFDRGKIKSIIENGKIKLSDRGEKLTLLSDLRKLIASGDLTSLIKSLNKLNAPSYINEIIVHTKRINNLNKNKRMGLLSFSESQLEETKIVNDILNMISEIENNP